MEKKENKLTKTEKTLVLLKKLINREKIGIKEESEITELLELDINLQKESKIRTLKRAVEPIRKIFNDEEFELFKYENGEYFMDSPNRAIQRFTKTNDDIFMISELAKSIDVEILEDIQEVANRDSKTFLFLNSEFERIEESKQKIFDSLRSSIEKRNYITIKYSHTKKENFERIKPLRILFNENNWYLLAIVKHEQHGEIVKFFRINFISEMKKHPETFQTNSIKKFTEFLEKIQNPMTLFGVPQKEARIEASPKVAIYFKEGRKKFLSSQKFLKEEDGKILFSVKYTQPMEVLPLIKKWLPDLKIVSSPDNELQKWLKKDLEKGLKSYDTISH
jgi:predicted DNA-binding transcriptional regulator YafY